MSDLETLERLEQSITQLLYEVDSNFSKCHRIITTNILPIVEKYSENSGQVWEHSKFWKQFFEASANVSLSGYEEQANQDNEDITHTRRDDSSFLDATETRRTPRQQYNEVQKGTGESPFDLTGDDESSILHRGSRMHTETPLNHRMESLEISSSPGDPPTPHTELRSSNRSYAPSSDTPTSSPMYPSVVDKKATTATPMTAPRSRNKNPLLHRVLDSNWKVQATPHSIRSRYTQAEESLLSTSPTSSPPEMTTQLGGNSRISRPQKTPSKGNGQYYDSDDDSSIGQMSPPVTMAFSLPPSKLLRTPAKEAAKHMVDEILRTAGANDLSTIPSETPQDPLDYKSARTGASGQGENTFMPGTQGTQNESRRLFERPGVGEDTPIARKNTGVLDHWHDSGEGSNWL